MEEEPQSQHHEHNKGHALENTSYKLSIDMSGDSPGEILGTLMGVVLPMLTGGIQHAENESVTTGVHFHFYMEEGFPRGVYLDGEGSILAVDDDGEILAIVRPDGTEDETARQLPLSASEWSALHGGLRDLHDLGPGDTLPTKEQTAYIAARIVEAGLRPPYMEYGSDD